MIIKTNFLQKKVYHKYRKIIHPNNKGGIILLDERKSDKLWKRFRVTGSIEDYLEYTKQTRKKKLNEENHQK